MVSETTLIEFTNAATSKLIEVLKEQEAEGSFLRIAATQNADGGR